MGNKKSTIFNPRQSINSDGDLNPGSSCSIFRRKNPEKFLDYNGASFDEYYSSTEGVSNEFVWSNKSTGYKQTLGNPEDFKQLIGLPQNVRHLNLAESKSQEHTAPAGKPPSQNRNSKNLENGHGKDPTYIKDSAYSKEPANSKEPVERVESAYGMVAVEHTHGVTVLDKLPTDWTQGPYVRKENMLRQTDSYGFVLQATSESVASKNMGGSKIYNEGPKFSSQIPRVANQDDRFNNQGARFSNQDARYASPGPRNSSQDAKGPRQGTKYISQDSRTSNQSSRTSSQDARTSSQDSTRPSSQDVRIPNQDDRAFNQLIKYNNQDARSKHQGGKFISQDAREVNQGARYSKQNVKYARSVPVVASFPDLLTASKFKQHIVETYENTTSSQPDLSDTSTIPYQVPVSYKTKTVPYDRRDSREGSVLSRRREIYGIPIQKSPAIKEVSPVRYHEVEIGKKAPPWNEKTHPHNLGKQKKESHLDNLPKLQKDNSSKQHKDGPPDNASKQHFKHKTTVHISHSEKKPPTPEYANVKIKKKAERNVTNVKVEDKSVSIPSGNVSSIYLADDVYMSDAAVESDVNGLLSEADTDDRRHSFYSYEGVLETSVDVTSDTYATSSKINPGYIRYISDSVSEVNVRDSPSSIGDSSLSFRESSASIRDSSKDVRVSSAIIGEKSSSTPSSKCPHSLVIVERMNSLVNRVKSRRERSRSQITEDDIREMSELEDDRNNSSSCNSSTAHVLGSAQTKAVCGSWKMIFTDLQKNGLQSVVNLFEVHPIIKNHFESLIRKSPIHLRLNDILNDHAYFVMNIIGIVIEHIDSLDLLSDLMDQLGKLHMGHGVHSNDIGIMGPVFCSAIRPILLKNEVWDVTIEESWMELFKLIVIMMRKPFESEKLPIELDMTPPQKCVIVGTWKSIFERQLVAGVGTRTIVDMFSAEPNIVKYFGAFKDTSIPDMFLKKAVQNHGIRVMNLVRMIVENIDNSAKIRDHMIILGGQHVKRGVKENYLDLMGPVFCQAIRPMLMDERQWSMEIEDAWSHLFKILSSLMKIAYKNGQVVQTFPSQSQVEILRSSWATILPKLDAVGVELFYYFFNHHDDLCHYFPQVRKQSTADIRMSKFIKDHSRRFMNIIKMFVDNLENLASIRPKLREIGEKHYKLGVRSEHLDIMGRVFCHSVRPLLVSNNTWSLQLEDTWLAAFRHLCENIKKGYPKDKRKTSKMRRTQ